MLSNPALTGGIFCARGLHRRASYVTRKGRCSTLNLLHDFVLKSIPI